MKRDRQRWGGQFWMILAVGAWLAAGLGAAKTADAATVKSGLLKSEANGVHCAVVNAGTSTITVDIAIVFGNDPENICNSKDDEEILPGQARGVQCSTTDGTYCIVTGNFSATKIRAKFSTRDGSGNDAAVLELK